MEYCKNVLVPVQCEYYALEGLVTLKSTIDQLNEARNLNIKIAGILRTMADWRNNLTHQVSSELEGHFKDLVLNTIIPRNVKLAEAPSYGQSILDYDIKSIGAEAFLSLSGEFIRKFENGRKKPLNKGLEALLGDVKKTPTMKKPIKTTKTEATNEALIAKFQKTNINQELF